MEEDTNKEVASNETKEGKTRVTQKLSPRLESYQRGILEQILETGSQKCRIWNTKGGLEKAFSRNIHLYGMWPI